MIDHRLLKLRFGSKLKLSKSNTWQSCILFEIFIDIFFKFIHSSFLGIVKFVWKNVERVIAKKNKWYDNNNKINKCQKKKKKNRWTDYQNCLTSYRQTCLEACVKVSRLNYYKN